MIKIYTFPECPFCKELKELLTKEGIEFEDVNVNLSENQDEFAIVSKVSNSNEVPIIKIDKQLFVPNVSFQSIPEALELAKKFLA
jgi:glutaredoxin